MTLDGGTTIRRSSLRARPVPQRGLECSPNHARADAGFASKQGVLMATVEVFRNQEKIATEFFRRTLYIEEDYPSGEIFWDVDGENPRVGVIRSWIQQADTNPRILGVFPEWHLIINGIPQESKFYEEVENLEGQTIELEYREYKFVLHFGTVAWNT